MIIRRAIILAAATLAVAGCATAPGPVEVTRFVAADRQAALGQGTIFVETAPTAFYDDRPGTLEAAAYKEAVARELVQLGYRETTRQAADQVARVDLERFVMGAGRERGPVSVGVGGSTGGYGSGIGLGVGFNLGGGPREEVGTRLAVSIRDRSSDAVLWEGRADFAVARGSDLAEPRANAAAIADALFREFPGSNAETVEVGVAR